MIDPETIQPGVYEISHERHESEIVLVHDDGRVYDFEASAWASVQDVIRRGWQFTARYVRCEGDPVEAICPCCHGKKCAVCDWHGRGLFIPEPTT